MKLSLILALRYLGASVRRTKLLYLLPAAVVLLFAIVFAADHVIPRMHAEKLLAFHAQYARLIGNLEWIIGAAALLVLVFVAAIRYLTIFTTLCFYAMFLGTMAMTIVMSVMSGFEGDIKHKILGTHAHVVVTRPDEAFTDWTEKLPLIAKTKGVLAVTGVLSGEAMIASSSNRSNVVVKGVDPVSIGKVTDLDRDIDVGALDSLTHPENIREPEPLEGDDDADLRLDGDDKPKPKPKKSEPSAEEQQRKKEHAPPGIIVGRELARSLRVYLGDDVSLISPTGGIGPSGSVPKARPYRVAGIFYSGMFEYDSKFVYVTLGSAEKLFDQPDEVTDLELKVPDPDRTEEVVTALQAQLGRGYDVDDWRSLNKGLFSALALEKVVMFIILSFIILVAGFSIVANGQMIATRKTAEIAILKSMGATDLTVAGAFVWLGAVLGVLGVFAGVAGGVLGAVALRKWGYALDPDVFYLTQLPVHVDPVEIVVVAISGFVLTIAATLYPAYMAARMQPIEGLREGGR